MSLQIQKNAEAFKKVAESSQGPNYKNHLYLRICRTPGMVGVATRKREASSFKAVKAYVKQILADKSGNLEEQKTIARSFETLTDSFANKKAKFIYRIFFFVLIFKKIQLQDARQLIKNFDTFAQNPQAPGLGNPGLNKPDPGKTKDLKKLNEKTAKALKEKEIFQYSALSAHFELEKQPIGSYVIWEGKKPGEYVFFQKQTEEIKDFSYGSIPAEAVVIPANKNLQQEINRLTSLETNFALLESQYKIHADYESAVKALAGSSKYALFYDNQAVGSKEIRFIQQVPGMPLTRAQSLIIQSTQDPFAFIKEQTSLTNQCELLKTQGLFSSEYSEKDKALKRLKNPGDYLVFQSGTYSSPTLHYVDQKGKVCAETFFNSSLQPKNLFTFIHKFTQSAQDNQGAILRLMQEGKVFKSSYDAEAFLKKQPAGTVVFTNAYYGSSLILKMPSGKTKNFWFGDNKGIDRKIAKLTSDAKMFAILKKEGLTVKDEKEAQSKLKYKSAGAYVIWKSAQGAYCMLSKSAFSKNQPVVVSLDTSQSNLLAEIDKQFPRPSTHPAYVEDKVAAKARLANQKIGDFVFYEKNSYYSYSKEYFITMKTSPTGYTEVKVPEEKLFDKLEGLKTSDGLWDFFKKAGYAFDDPKKIQASHPDQEFFLWKEKDQSIKFIPVVKGASFSKITPMTIRQEHFLDDLRAFQNPDNKLCNKWFTDMGVIANNEQEARKELLNRPLGSYMLWRELDSWCFLQKLDNEKPIDNAPIQINFGKSLWQEIAKLTSEEAELNWVKSYAAKFAQTAQSPGDFSIKLLVGSSYWCTRIDLFGHATYEVIKAPHFWKQIDRLTSRQAQIKHLKSTASKFFVANRAEAEKKLSKASNGTFFIWELPDGTVEMLIKAVAGPQYFKISLEENLCKRIFDVFRQFSAEKTPKPKKAPTRPSGSTTQRVVFEAKSTFLKVLNPQLTEKEIAEISFQMCKGIFRKAQLANHPDRVPESKKAEAEEKIKAINNAKDAFVKSLGDALHKDIPFNEPDLALIDNIYPKSS
ncbi:MAG: hypothetical protein CK425_11060 [Parachlamydia sp.]|nr:MAG: hypothetical protein CK425_11060 [Parachlamydia sp.]